MLDQLTSVDRSASVYHTRRFTRHSPFAVLVILSVVVLKLFSQHFPAVSREDFWIPWLEVQTWEPLRWLVFGAFLAIGAIVTFRVALRQSALFWPALGITLAIVWVFPIGGSSAGFALCSVVLWACTRYIDGPDPAGFWLLTLLTVLVSVLRVDFGVYVGIAALAALFARHVREGLSVFVKAALGYAGALLVLILLFVPLGQVQASLKGLSLGITHVIAQGSDVPGRTFNVRWAIGVDDSTRREKERELALIDGQEVQGDGRTWRYRWTRLSSKSVLHLLNDSAVEDTQGIDRGSARYVGNRKSDANFEWLRALPFGTGEAALKATALAPWLWVVLPIAGAIRVSRSMMRRVPTDLESPADVVALPALALCLPIARLVLTDSGDVAFVAAPVFSALAVTAAWLVSVPFISHAPEAAASDWNVSARARAVSTERPYDAYICLALTVLTVFLHLYVNTDITNDHAAYLSMARQIVLGNWPIRDFRDDGALLQILLSAAVQKIGGFRLFGEMLLSWTFFAAANCLTYWLALRLSGKRLAAATAAALAALLIPRPYAYPKLFIYPFAILILWRYIERPRTGRLAAVAATIALAFLFRIDHGVVIAVSSVIAVAAVNGHDLRTAIRQCLLLAAGCLLFGLPQLAYILWSVGLPRYLESVGTFGVFALTHRDPWPVGLSLQRGLLSETNAAAFLLNLSILIAAVAFYAAGSQIRRAWAQGTAASRESLWLLATVVMWILMLPMLARGEYYTRLAEVGQPVAILAAWLAVRWLSTNPASVRRWAAFAAAVTITIVAVCCRMPVGSFFRFPGKVFDEAPFQVHILQDLATSPPLDEYAPKDAANEFRKLVRWTSECTKPDDRLIVTWFAPEVYFFSGRAFAGDRWSFGPFDNSSERQHVVVEQIRSQSVPIALIDVDTYPSEFEHRWPLLAAYLNASYRLVTKIPVEDDRVIGVLVLNSRTPSRSVQFRNLPCFN